MFRNDVDNFDFSPRCLPARLAQLRGQGEFLLMLYREKVGYGEIIDISAQYRHGRELAQR
ncbi:MAG: hypothetical protein ABR553_03250 [Gammaproteobacteria bacterium]